MIREKNELNISKQTRATTMTMWRQPSHNARDIMQTHRDAKGTNTLDVTSFIARRIMRVVECIPMYIETKGLFLAQKPFPPDDCDLVREPECAKNPKVSIRLGKNAIRRTGLLLDRIIYGRSLRNQQ